MFETPTDPITRAVYQHFLRLFAQTGQPPGVEALASAANLPDLAAVNHHLHQMETIGCIYRHPVTGQIISAYPFSTIPTQHRVALGGNPEVYAICAIDALGMPFMFDRDAVIHSSCPQCGKELMVHITEGIISAAVPDEMVVVYASAPANCCAATDQCPYINFFCSLEHAQSWQASQPQLISKVMSLTEALDGGHATFGNVLRSAENNIQLYEGKTGNDSKNQGRARTDRVNSHRPHQRCCCDRAAK